MKGMGRVLKMAGIIAGVILLLTGFGIWRSIDKLQVAMNVKEAWSRQDGTVYKDLTYGNKDYQKYDLYIPQSASVDEKQSVILFVHGGGWSGGSKKEMAFACKRYAKAGYMTATIEYGLLGDKNPENSMDTIMEDIDGCIRAMKAEIEGRGYEVKNIAIGGGSAGGHLSLLYAYQFAEASAIPIAFVASQSGPVGVDYGAEGVSDEVVAAARNASPIQFVNEDTVPTLLCHGQKDMIVPYAGTMALIEKLKQYNVEYSFVDYPNSNHTLESDPDSHKQYHSEMLAFCRKYFE